MRGYEAFDYVFKWTVQTLSDTKRKGIKTRRWMRKITDFFLNKKW
jgi:hypothetical protein